MTGLYLHIPFCLGKCPYCDFFSCADQPELLVDYHQLLLQQLRLALRGGWQGPFATVFFGGGTPSLLAPGQVATILEEVAASAGLTADAEITLEANPGTVDRAKLSAFRAAGVNRLSLGIQSCDDRQLQRLGRRHDRAAGVAAIEAARAAGFDNLNLDLMFALPGQSEAELAEDLGQLLAWQPEHLAVYGLTIETGTPYAVECPPAEPLPDEERYAAMYLLIHDRLVAGGYGHYEISNFARPDRSCRHNRNTWARGPYLGLGAGAHSFCAAGWGRRLAVPADLQEYRRRLAEAADPAELLESFSRREAMSETAYLALRTAEGLDAAAFAAIFGQPFEAAFPEALARLAGRLRSGGGRWRFAASDWLLYDHLIAEFF